ncbi:MAG: LTA synthase family protein [Bacteroidota bacterium]
MHQPSARIISTFLFRYVHVLVWLQLARLLFVVLQPDTAGPFWEVFLTGLRYDITTVCILNIVPMVLSGFGLERFKPLGNIIAIWTLAVNSIALLLNLIDAAWFRYTAQRCNADLLFMAGNGNDLWNVLPAYIADYWYLALIWFAGITSLVLVEKRISASNLKTPPESKGIDFRKTILLGSSLALLCIVGFRGGFQLKPLSVQASVRFVPNQSVPLALNSAFTFIKSMDDTGLDRIEFMPASQAKGIFNANHPATSQVSPRLNLVFLILESMSFDYVSYYGRNGKLTPFLDSLMEAGHSWPNCFANGKKSIDGVPAVVSSLPALMPQAFISSSYNLNTINSAAKLLAPYGYTTAFFHGGTNGTMGFDNFASLAGYQTYYGKNEYDGPESDDDGNWGIADHAYYGFMVRKLNSWKEPFHATFFSLSSHHPYTVPETYRNRIPDSVSPIDRSIAYADLALKGFFNDAKQQPWFNRTVFVITADHSGPNRSPYSSARIGTHHIPLVFLLPNDTTGVVHREIAQQSDILPSALHAVGYPKSFTAYGRNLFESGIGFSVSRSETGWQLISDSLVVQLSDERKARCFSRKDTLLRKPMNCPANSPELMLLKSFVQQFNTAMIDNSLTKP